MDVTPDAASERSRPTPPLAVDGLKCLEDFVARHVTLSAAAKALKISPQYLKDLLSEHRPLTEKVLRRMGLKRLITIVPR